MTESLVWYVSFGSNLLRERFMLYITGGHLPDYARNHRGCPDPTPPRQDASLELPGELFFASHPILLPDMAIAYINSTATDHTFKARAYLITQEQFECILAQECGMPDSIPVDLAALRSKGQLKIGDGNELFNQLLYLGERHNHPLVTFTNSGEHVQLGAPKEAYLGVLLRGLMQAHEMSEAAARSYFRNKRGIGKLNARSNSG